MTKRLKRVKISELIFYPITPTPKGLVCYISFTYNNSIRIQDCAIVTRPQGGYRILYPVKTLANGKSISSVYPISKEVGNEIEDFLLLEYNKFLKIHNEEDSNE